MTTHQLYLTINLNPENNPYLKLGFLANPFELHPTTAVIENPIITGLRTGIEKTMLPELLRKLGLKQFAIDEILKRVEPLKKYSVHILFDDVEKKGELKIQELK